MVLRDSSARAIAGGRWPRIVATPRVDANAGFTLKNGHRVARLHYKRASREASANAMTVKTVNQGMLFNLKLSHGASAC